MIPGDFGMFLVDFGVNPGDFGVFSGDFRRPFESVSGLFTSSYVSN